MIILGIDPGYATTGYGVIEKDRNNLVSVDYGVITTPAHREPAGAAGHAGRGADRADPALSAESIAIEELFFNTNITTGIKVAEARGVILLAAIRECGHLYEYTPLQVKQALTGQGRAEKKQVQYMVRALLGLKSEPKPDDAADALAVAVCHANMQAYRYRTLN